MSTCCSIRTADSRPAFSRQLWAPWTPIHAPAPVTGRLLRFRTDSLDGELVEELADDILDTTGMVGRRNWRVLDRSAESPARGTDLHDAYVFGASGAAAVYRRAMLDDVAFDGEFFDEAFFAFREDVDLAWRAQMLGWSCRYVPAALARHRRRVTPGRRRSLPSRINRLSVANRWRMIAKNETAVGWAKDWWAVGARDAGVLGYALFKEPRTMARCHRCRPRRPTVRRGAATSCGAVASRTTR